MLADEVASRDVKIEILETAISAYLKKYAKTLDFYDDLLEVEPSLSIRQTRE